MEPRGWSAFVGAVALLMVVGVPIVRTASVDQKIDRQAQEEEKPSEKKDGSYKKPAHPWCEAASLYWEYFGQGDRPECREEKEAWSSLDKTLASLPPEYELTFLIATVPEPLDSSLPANFDQALQGIQQAYASSEYLLDRIWLPWNNKKLADSKAHRRFPGILLFRMTDAQTSKLATVLLVGESPKSGIHKEAFRNAVRLASIEKPLAAMHLPVLGPSFSGSNESLYLALQQSTAETGRRFRIATGTATAAQLEKKLQISGISNFCRAALPDQLVEELALKHLREKLGWDRGRVAMLSESDTGYGNPNQPSEPGQRKQNGTEDGPLRIDFPSGISDVRIAWERNRNPAEAQVVLKEPKRALDLTLAGQEKPADMVPKLSPLSVQDDDLALSNLFRSLSREQVSYVGIKASDVRDKLFLAKRIQRFLPDVVLFTLEGDLLYGHPEVGEAMEGMLVFSSFPLITEGQAGLSSSSLKGRQRRQFSSEFQRGIFEATSYLLSNGRKAPGPQPQVWISAVGNGSAWPLARLEIPETDKRAFQLCATSMATSPGDRRPGLQNSTEKRDLQILLALGALILLARGLSGVVVPPQLVRKFEGRGGGAKLARAKAWALALGIAVLWVSGAALVALGSMPWWVRSFHPISRIFTVMLALGYVFLVWNLGRVAWPSFGPAASRLVGRRQKQFFPFLAWIFLGLLLPALLTGGLSLLANPGGPELFYFRARAFSSGFSPFVSLAWLGGALYTWAYLELFRYRTLVRHLTEWPLQESSERWLRHLPDTAKELGSFLRGTLGPGWTFLAGAAFALFPLLVLLGKTVQPIAEPKSYGYAFLALCFVSLTLSVISFQRFWKIWRLLEKVLLRLEHSPLVSSFQRISSQIAWSPMKSFWQVPVFNVLLLSLKKLRKVVDRMALKGEGSLDRTLNEKIAKIEESLDDALEARRKQEIGDEISARWDIQDTLLELCRLLAPESRDLLVQEFFSLRIISYIRHVFSHMRSSLLAAMLGALLTLVAVSSYAFEPKQLVSLVIWGVLLLGVALTVWTFVQMDRNAVLSVISGTKPGQVTFNRPFLLNVLTYGVLPLAGVVVTQFPDLGSMVVRWLNPLLQVAGID